MFERLRKLDAEFDCMRGEIARAFAHATEHDVQALTDEAVKAVRRHRGPQGLPCAGAAGGSTGGPPIEERGRRSPGAPQPPSDPDADRVPESSLKNGCIA